MNPKSGEFLVKLIFLWGLNSVILVNQDFYGNFYRSYLWQAQTRIFLLWLFYMGSKLNDFSDGNFCHGYFQWTWSKSFFIKFLFNGPEI